MEDLSLHILDIVENAIRAEAKNISVEIAEWKEKDLLTLEIIDDGEGMDEETLKHASSPFFTTKDKKKKIGLGLSLLEQSAKEAEGNLAISSKKGMGTKVVATFKLSHIDRKPIGNIDETMKVLRASHPDINFLIKSNIAGKNDEMFNYK